MEFTKIISSPVFAASAPDIGLEAQSASPVKIVVTTPSASWDITLSPVSDADGKKLLNIRLRDILSAVASAPDPSETEPNSASPLLMVNLSASNTEGEQASIDIPVAFGTLNGKDPKDFTGQWLTSREQICLTYSWARERLSLIFGPQLLRWSGSVSLTVNCRAYYASGKARNFQLVSAGSSDTVYYSVDCSYSAISALDDSGEQLVAWDLSYTLSGINADGESDSVDSFPQRFILANQDGRIREYIFANCFGMEDRVFGEGVARREVNGSSSTFVNGGKTLEVSNDAEIVYEAFSGQLADRRAIFHWYDFLSSSSRLIFSAADGSMTHIVVEGHDSETDDFSVGGVSFSYRLSEKNGVYPDGLCGTIGDYDPNQQCGALWVGDDPQAVTPAEEDLFFLKHRLSEFQTLTVSDALLLLVQSPATDAWGSVSLGSIKSWVKKFLDGESREIRLNSLADYETADGKVIDPSKLQNGSIPVWDAAAGAYHPVPASELGDYGINPKLYPLVFQKGKDVVLTYAPNVGKAVLDISDFASAETLSTHISDKDIHVTAEQKSAWDLVASLFGVNEEGNIYIKNDRGLISYSFVSVHGSDPAAGSSSAFDSDVMWTLLGADTAEKINISHLPSIPATMVSGLGSATAGKVAHSLTVKNDGGSATAQDKIFDGGAAVTVTIPTSLPASDVPSWAKAATKPSYTWSEIDKKPSTLSGFGITDGVNDAEASGNLTGIVSGHKLKIGVADGYTIPSVEKIALWDKICALFDIDDNGDVRVTGGRGLSSDSFISVHGSDPEAGQGGIGGLDIDAMWDALAESGTQKINASHIPLLQQLSGTLTNAQLANSSVTVAGVAVSLGGSVSAAQIASALTEAGYKLTDTVTTLASLGITATAAELNFMDGVTSNIQTQLNAKANASALAAYALKDGSNASGTWPISVSGTATYAAVLSNNDDTNVSQYLKYRTVSGQTSLVGSNAVNGAWCLPTTGGDAKYGNGQILRFGWAQSYYTDLHTGPNEIGSNSGLQFRQVVAGAVSSLGWRTLLDTANYAGYLDTRYLLKSSYTAADILAKLKTVDGSGSGLDADLLDGYQATALSRLLSYINSGTKTAAGWYRVFTASSDRTNALGVNIILHLARSYNYTDNEAYTFCISVAYNNQVDITQVSGLANVRLITKIRVVSVNSGALYVDFYLSQSTNGNTYYITGSGPGTFQEAAAVSAPVGNVTEFTTVNGCKSSGGFTGALSGNASSATKLATARIIWGRSFDGSGDISGNIIVGDAIIHGSVTSNNTRFISSDNASNIYFSVGGLVDLVAEPSCLRRGASNTSETLGTSTYRWANVYAVNGDYSGNLAVSGWINGGLNISTFGSNSDNSDTTRFLTYGHRVEFGGPGYAHVNYYLRPRYSASGETHAGLYIQNASAAASPVFSTTHYFDHNGNAYHSGNLGIGTAAPQAKLDVNGTIHSTTGIWSNGYVSAKGQDTTSDARYKRDVAALPAQAALAVLMRLRPSTWAWKDDGRRGAGFVAQEVLGVLPEAVREFGNGEDRHLALNYQMLHAYEVCLLQTHETELERLRGRVNQLENEIKRIRHES